MDIKITPLTDAENRPVVPATGFGNVFTNRMFMQKWTTDRGWHEAGIGAFRPIQLDPSASVLHYAQEIFEGTKAYRRPDGGVNLFRPWENAARFNRSAARMAMPSLDIEDHVQAMAALVRLESDWVPNGDGQSLYIRPTMIATQAGLGVGGSNSFLHYIITAPVTSLISSSPTGFGVWVSDDHVRAVRGGTGTAKTGGNYAAGIASSERAKKAGYQQVLWLDAIHRRYVEEVGGMNIAFVRGREIVTPALSGSILEGITRDSVLKMVPDLGYTVKEDLLDINELLADIDRGVITESFGIGTAAVIAPVARFRYKDVDHAVNGGKVGPVTQHIYKALTDLQYGRREDPYGWTLKV